MPISTEDLRKRNKQSKGSKLFAWLHSHVTLNELMASSIMFVIVGRQMFLPSRWWVLAWALRHYV